MVVFYPRPKLTRVAQTLSFKGKPPTVWPRTHWQQPNLTGKLSTAHASMETTTNLVPLLLTMYIVLAVIAAIGKDLIVDLVPFSLPRMLAGLCVTLIHRTSRPGEYSQSSPPRAAPASPPAKHSSPNSSKLQPPSSQHPPKTNSQNGPD